MKLLRTILWQSQCINSCYILFCPFMLIKRIAMKVRAQISSTITVPFITTILFKTYQLNSLITLHRFTEKLSRKQLWMVSKHYLLLNTSMRQCPSTNKLVSKIYLYLPIIIFNTLIISSHNNLTHFFIFAFLDKILYPRINNLPSNCQLLPSILFPQLFFKVLNNRLCLKHTMIENKPKIALIRKWSLGFTSLIKLLFRKQAKSHRTNQKEYRIFTKSMLQSLLPQKQRIFKVVLIQYKRSNLLKYFRNVVIVLFK